MRPTLDTLAEKICNKLGDRANCDIVSCRFVSNTDQWVARLEDHSISDKRYYRIAEGFGDNVVFVSPRMPFNVSTFSSQQGSDSDRSVTREIRGVTVKMQQDQHAKDMVQIEFDQCLDRLFEGRDG